MQMDTHGNITHEGFRIRPTAYGEWQVSIGSTLVGDAPTLDEAERIIEQRKREVRENLARLTAEHEARQREEESMPAEILTATKKKG